ncbi:MAG TPA: GlmU family protein [Bacteroidia bacterium]|nr:GlmU family protein [Bacteroidia bacterium]
MNYILFDEALTRLQLLPFTFTRPVSEIRIGILTIKEKWEKVSGQKTSVITEEYLAEKYPFVFSKKEDNIWVNGSVLPTAELFKAIKALKKMEALKSGDILIAVNTGREKMEDFIGKTKSIEWIGSPVLKINHLWDIFSLNGIALELDYKLLTKGKKSLKVSKTNTLLGKNIFIEKGAKLECAILNSTTGPIYIGKDAEVMEGSVIRGPFALGEGATIKAGAKIYGPTTVGPHSKVGGEVSNSVIFGYSNKGHDGFLGNSVIGEWCNLGADTNTSNLKNNYSEVSVYDYSSEKMVPTGLTFCGLMMGDHSKCSINTMFNTGTVVGVSVNIFGGNFPPKFVPSFSWGGSGGFTTYELPKAFETAERVFERRHKKFDTIEKSILEKVFSLTKNKQQ